MDRQGNYVTSKEDAFLETFREEGLEKDDSESDRKVTREEYLSSPEYQRRQKIATERFDQASFLRKVAFRKAQQENPIKGRPRRKRGRKRR